MGYAATPSAPRSPTTRVAGRENRQQESSVRTPRFHTTQPLPAGQTLELESGPSHHLARVLRIQTGAAVVLFNGDGFDYPAQIVTVEKRAVTVALGEAVPAAAESPLTIELGVAISKGERMDFVVQKATELGVTRIVPLLTERVEVRLKGDREERRLEHWRGIAIAACEQSGRATIPQLSAPLPYAQWLAGCSAERRFVLHHRTDSALAGTARPASVALAIGPEGGLTAAEIAQAEAAGFEALQLGPRVLRTETAPLAALSILQFAWGDLG